MYGYEYLQPCEDIPDLRGLEEQPSWQVGDGEADAGHGEEQPAVQEEQYHQEGIWSWEDGGRKDSDLEKGNGFEDEKEDSGREDSHLEEESEFWGKVKELLNCVKKCLNRNSYNWCVPV